MQTSAIRYMHFESTTLVVSSIKDRVSSESADKADAVKKVPLAEKKQRREDQVARLSGISMTGELDPSHALLDIANQILETGSILWLAPSKCTKRDDEVQMALKDSKSSVQVENAQLKVGPSADVIEAEWNSDLKYQWCMMRRGLAFDQCRLLSWSVHQQWTNYLLNMLSRPAVPGFQPVRLEQLVRADRELWTILAQETTGSLKATGGAIPLDAKVRSLTTDPRITMLLLPLPNSQRAPTENANTPKASRPAGSPAPKKSTKRKSRAERGCPEELKKYTLKVAAGQICWNYNLKDGCQLPTNGKPAKCNRGLHICASCHKPNHSVVVCHGNKTA